MGINSLHQMFKFIVERAWYLNEGINKPVIVYKKKGATIKHDSTAFEQPTLYKDYATYEDYI